MWLERYVQGNNVFHSSGCDEIGVSEHSIKIKEFCLNGWEKKTILRKASFIVIDIIHKINN